MVIIDVRTKEEYDEGHIDGALHYNVVDMVQGVFPNIDKNIAITLYCVTGNRSGRAKNLMENIGFEDVVNGGGMKDLINKL